MKFKSTHLKIFTAFAVAFLSLTSLFVFPVNADDEENITYRVSYIDYFTRYQDKSYNYHIGVTEVSMEITLPSNLRPIFIRYHKIDENGMNWYYLMLYNLDMNSGLLKKNTSTIPAHLVITSPASGEVVQDKDSTFSMSYINHDYEGLFYAAYPDVNGIPVYEYPDDKLQELLSETSHSGNNYYDTDLIDGTKIPTSGQPWFAPSANVEGFFDKTVPIPVVQNADVQYRATANSEMYTLIFDWKHYLSGVAISSSDKLLSGLKTEIWVRCPYNSDGTKTTFQRIKSADLNSFYNSETGSFGITLTDEEMAFAVAESAGVDYNYILEKVIRDRRKIQVYVRNVKQTDSELLSSGYSWFTFLSSNIGKDITINKNTNQTLDVDGANDANSSIDHEGNDGRPSGGGDLPGRGEWTTDDLEDFIGGGFGLAGDNGLIALIGNVITFIPKPIINLLYFFLGACAVIAVIKLVF